MHATRTTITIDHAQEHNAQNSSIITTIRTETSPQGTQSAKYKHLTQCSKVLADGTIISSTDPRTDHVAVIDHGSGLMISVESLGSENDPDSGMTQQDCARRCEKLSLLGYNDWRQMTRTELAALVDDTRSNPAIDTNLFPRVKPRLHWTSTPLVDSEGKASASVAWLVNFYNGNLYYLHRLSYGFALAVRRAGQ